MGDGIDIGGEFSQFALIDFAASSQLNLKCLAALEGFALGFGDANHHFSFAMRSYLGDDLPYGDDLPRLKVDLGHYAGTVGRQGGVGGLVAAGLGGGLGRLRGWHARC